MGSLPHIGKYNIGSVPHIVFVPHMGKYNMGHGPHIGKYGVRSLGISTNKVAHPKFAVGNWIICHASEGSNHPIFDQNGLSDPKFALFWHHFDLIWGDNDQIWGETSVPRYGDPCRKTHPRSESKYGVRLQYQGTETPVERLTPNRKANMGIFGFLCSHNSFIAAESNININLFVFLTSSNTLGVRIILKPNRIIQSLATAILHWIMFLAGDKKEDPNLFYLRLPAQLFEKRPVGVVTSNIAYK